MIWVKEQHELRSDLPALGRPCRRSSQGALAKIEHQVSAYKRRTSSIYTRRWHVTFASASRATLMGKIHLQAVITLTLAFVLASAAHAAPGPDAQGWNGRGWYITGSAPAEFLPVAAPNYILFEGPHPLKVECMAIYDRLYSPIGMCRYLDQKPVAPAK